MPTGPINAQPEKRDDKDQNARTKKAAKPDQGQTAAQQKLKANVRRSTVSGGKGGKR